MKEDLQAFCFQGNPALRIAAFLRRCKLGGDTLPSARAKGSRSPASLSQMGTNLGCRVLVGNHDKSMERSARLMCFQSKRSISETLKPANNPMLKKGTTSTGAQRMRR